MNLVIISGLSGSGKSVALDTLEDLGYYCIDNLPMALLDAFTREFSDRQLLDANRAAVGIDARNNPGHINRFPGIIEDCRKRGLDCRIIFLQADDNTLLKRFSETRRKHPLSGPDTPLADAMREERELLTPITAMTDLFIDTSRTNIYQLRDLVRECIVAQETPGVSLVLRSFGYKHGIPADADFVFDARCLPNPHWEAGLRNLTGRDREVIDFLEREASVRELGDNLSNFLTIWVPRFSESNRSYLTVAIGCTGGQHRSVYLVEHIAARLGGRFGNIIIRHRELE
jgi:UPF0042 nucleotide-binding protein